MEQILYPVSDSVSYMQNISKMQKYAKQQYAEITMSNMLNMEPFFDMNNIVQYANNTTNMPKGPNIPNMFTGTTNYFTNMQTIWTPFIWNFDKIYEFFLKYWFIEFHSHPG